MLLIESSKDILYLVLAFCAVWATIFLCWLLYSAIAILRDVHTIVAEIKNKFALIERALSMLREKLEKSSSSLFLIAEGVSKGIAYLLQRSEKKQDKSSKK